VEYGKLPPLLMTKTYENQRLSYMGCINDLKS
jgi:hypothetical protein